MPQESITDTTRPNAGRIYDYILGGNHNFEVDRQAGDQLLSLMPTMPKMFRMQRWCLQDVAKELSQKRGYDVIIDFASGLPTNDHIHTVVPKGTKVIYSDWDPVVVEYARDILKNTPDVYFFHADARHPEELLDRPEVGEILGGRRDVALIAWGLALFLTDEDIAGTSKALFEWAGTKSCWAFFCQGGDMDITDPGFAKTAKIYEQMGSKLNVRNLARFQELLKPWRADKKGYIPFLEWHGLDEKFLKDEPDKLAWGKAGGGYGVYLVK
jgi:hypothetical protein